MGASEIPGESMLDMDLDFKDWRQDFFLCVEEI